MTLITMTTLMRTVPTNQAPRRTNDLIHPHPTHPVVTEVIAMYSRDRGVEGGKLVQGPVVTFNILSADGHSACAAS